MRTGPIAVVTLLVGLAAACVPGDTAADEPMIVVSTTIIGSVVASVVGNDARVEVLMPIGADPHDFEASARQVALIAGSDLVVWVGGLEPGLAPAVEQAEANGTRVLELLPLVDPLATDVRGNHGTEPAVERTHGDLDPHFWFDPTRMATAVEAIGASLAEMDPSTDWEARAAVYAAEVEATDAEIADILAPVPAERRKLVTNHDTLSYFAERYGFEVVGTVIPSVTSLAEPSSAEMASLVRTIEKAGVPAIFAETTNPTTLANAIASELGEQITVVTIFSDSLGGPGSGAETYLDLIRSNAAAVADALT